MTFEEWFDRYKAPYIESHLVFLTKEIMWEGWEAFKEHGKINADFEVVCEDGWKGSTSVDVKRVVYQDDDSITVVLDYWPKGRV